LTVRPRPDQPPWLRSVYEWVIGVSNAGYLTEDLITQSDNPIRAQFIKYECKKVTSTSGAALRRQQEDPDQPPAEQEVCEWKGAA